MADNAAWHVASARADDFAGDIATDREGIRPAATDNAGDHIGIGRQDIESVITLHPVNFCGFDIGISDAETCARNTGVSDQEGVRSFGSKHRYRINPSATVDLDRSIDVVQEGVVTAAPQCISQTAARNCRAVLQKERAQNEAVVPVFAHKTQIGLVGINAEDVFAFAAINQHRQRVADRQEALRGLIGLHLVAHGHIGADTGRAEHLTDLEGVIALTAVQRHQSAGIVRIEAVVSSKPVDRQTPVDAGIVIQTLELRGHIAQNIRVQQCHEVAADQCMVVRTVAQIDGQEIRTIVRRATVGEGHDIRYRNRAAIDDEFICATLAIH